MSVEFQRDAALASEASGQRGHSQVRAPDTREGGSSARARRATITLRGPQAPPPAAAEAMVGQGAEFWPLKLARELDDAILDIRANEFDVAAIVFKSSGDPAQVLAYDQFLDANKDHWLAREIRGLWKRVLKRIDLTSRSLVALVEPGSCFAGTLAELVFASDRSYMLIGKRDGDNKPPATLALAAVNFGAYPMSNGLSRLASRFLADPADLDRAKAAIAEMLDAEAAQRLGLVTFALDDIDWEDENPRVSGGARELFRRRSDRARSQSALRRPGDHGIENLRAPHRVAELDFPAPQRRRRGGRAQALRHRPEAGIRHAQGVRAQMRTANGK